MPVLIILSIFDSQNDKFSIYILLALVHLKLDTSEETLLIFQPSVTYGFRYLNQQQDCHARRFVARCIKLPRDSGDAEIRAAGQAT
jgi:hypothetical protein